MNPQEPSINFSKYTLQELYEAQSSVDKEKYPHNAKEIDRLIEIKEKELSEIKSENDTFIPDSENLTSHHDGIFKRIMSGNISLPKMFWLFWALPVIIIIPILTRILVIVSAFIHPILIIPIVAISAIGSFIYNIFCYIGIWKSSANYSGRTIWKYLARLIIVLQILAAISFIAVELFEEEPEIKNISTSFNNSPEIENQLTGTDSNNNHGTLDYKIIDYSGNLIKEGHLVVNEIKTQKNLIPSFGGQKYFEDKYIIIDDSFVIGMNNYGYKSPSSVGGFGITFERIDYDTFSWEWYDQEQPKSFKKRQEGGELNVDFIQRDGFFEIKKIDFVGDQRLRCDNKAKFSDTKGWLLYIKDGSNIIF